MAISFRDWHFFGMSQDDLDAEKDGFLQKMDEAFAAMKDEQVDAVLRDAAGTVIASGKALLSAGEGAGTFAPGGGGLTLRQLAESGKSLEAEGRRVEITAAAPCAAGGVHLHLRFEPYLP